MNGFFSDIVELLSINFSDDLDKSNFSNGELTITINSSAIKKIIDFLFNNSECQFKTLIDITAVDFPSRKVRFDVVYHLLSMAQNKRIRIKFEVDETDIIPSISSTHLGANWLEREVFDMYGLSFSNHPDLRRILTDYGFQGHPLRKDFPTSGYQEVKYDEEQKKVVYQPVSLTQEYRQFDFLSPWEGAKYLDSDK
mgnify:CR=1 FL=1|tara:strand:+ start:312 stop:899 length:588 start_codon:yes stop_codon:yes gene_type:complete